MSALVLDQLTAGYGDVPVVRGLDLHVDPGEVVALIGPNGAGKSTVLWTAAGVLPVISGRVCVQRREVGGMSAHAIARLGVALVPDDRGIFHQLSVGENLRLRAGRRDLERIDMVLEQFPVLRPLLARRAGLLSGGEQQMLALGCALASRPTLLMIDEMSLGLAPIIVEDLLPAVRDLAATSGMAVLLVEQQVSAVLKVADRAYLLRHGELTFAGSAAELAGSPEALQASYLGSGTPPSDLES